MIDTPASRDLREFYARSATLGTTERYREATRAEAYYLGLQYNHLRPWNANVPLVDRKPLIIEPLFKRTIHALEDFIWSGHRFPRPTVEATRSEGMPEDVGPALDVSEAKALTRFVRQKAFFNPLQKAIREASRKALITTSAAVILGVIGGKIRAHVEPGKHCIPTFSKNDPDRVTRLDIVYQVEREEPTYTGSTRTRMYWYRRSIDELSDTVFVEQPVIPGRLPEWEVNQELTVTHALNFCPVVWLRTLSDCTDQVDGVPVIDPQLYPLIDAISYTLSQRHRSVSYGLDPQPIRTGVEEADREALEKSPGKVWDLPQGGSFQFAEVNGSGVVRGSEHIDDLTKRFYSAVRVVMMDPQALSGDISGRVLEMIHAPMVSLASTLREDFGDFGLCAMISLALRIITTVSMRGENVWIPGYSEAVRILSTSQLQGPWLDPPICLQWNGFFEPSKTEEQQQLSMQSEAVREKFLSKRSAMRNLQPVLHIEDVDAELEAMEDEREKKPSMPPPPNPTPTVPPTEGETEEPEAPEVELTTPEEE